MPQGGGDAVRQAFIGGYLAAGVLPDLLPHFVDVVIPCESGWRIDPGGFHLGLAQFNPDSWARVAARTGYWDWRDPWQHGYNVAVWASLTTPSQQWSCW